MNDRTRKKNFWPEAEYGLQVAATSAVGGAIGYATDHVLNRFHAYEQLVLQTAKRLDEKTGKAIVEKGGPVGEAVIKVDEAQGNFWSRVLGRTPEQQEAWRQKHDLGKPTYIQRPNEGTQTATVVTQPEPTPHYEGSHLGLTIGLLAGAGYGTLSRLGNYLRSRRERTLRNTVADLTAQTADLNKRLTEVEPKGLERRVEDERQ